MARAWFWLEMPISFRLWGREIFCGISSGRIVLYAEGMKALPSLMGMPDVLKVLELTPGVQTSGEG